MALPTNWEDGEGMQVDADFLNDLGEAVNASVYSGPRSDLASTFTAAPSNAGAHYFCTDCDAVYKSTGSAWTKIRVAGKQSSTLADPPSGLSTTAMGSDTFTASKDARVLALAASGSAWRVEYATLSPTSNYTATAYIEVPGDPGANAWITGLVLMASNGTTMIGFGPGNNSNAGVMGFGAVALNAINSTKVAVIPPFGLPNWYRIRDDGTNNNFEYSLNGSEWFTAFSEGRTATLTPARIGWGGFNSGAIARKARLRSFSVS